METKISVITACYNAESTIAETIRSVLKQTHGNIEHVVVDGGSSDQTNEIIGSFAQAYTEAGVSLVWSSEKDRGIQDAYNKALTKASGDWTFFLNSGDYLLDEDVIKVILEEKNAERADIIYGNIRLFFHKKKITSELHYPDSITLGFLRRSTICHQAVFFRRGLFEHHGNYELEYRIASDFDRILVFHQAGARFHHVNRTCCIFVDDGVSGTDFVRSLDERIKILRRRLGRIRMGDYGYHYGLMFLLFVRRKVFGFIG